MNTAPLKAKPEWTLRPLLSKERAIACQQVGIRFVYAQLLTNRGITAFDAMQRFLHARLEDLFDPLMLPDMECALQRIQRALVTGESITVFGDFDADGVTSAALLFRALRMLGHTALSSYIPHRTQEERGLSRNALDQLKAWGTTLIITTDCGSSDVEAVAYAQEVLGIDVIITDHHRPPDVLPQARALVNPWLSSSRYPERYLCGAGVAYKLVLALFRAASRTLEEQEALLDLVAIGTIADVAPLLGENHTLARHGLLRLNDTSNPGLRALIEVSGLRPGRIQERDVGYGIGPRLNAAGRMEHADLAFELLITEDPDKAAQLALKLEGLNTLRKEQTARLMTLAQEQAQGQAGNAIVFIEGPQDIYHEGIIGLVAGKLAEVLKCPVFVLSLGESSTRGSARSYGGLNLIEALHAHSDLFIRHGGHAEACGFSMTNENIEELRTHLYAWFSPPSPPADVDALPELGAPESISLAASEWIDLVVKRPEAFDSAAWALIQQLGPFGAGNPEPIFRMNDVRIVNCWNGGYDGETLQVRLQHGEIQFRGSYKGAGDVASQCEVGMAADIIFHLSQAIGKAGEKDIFLRILHVEPAERSRQ